MLVVDAMAEGVDMSDQPAARVVLVADGRPAERVFDRLQVVRRIVEVAEGRGVTLAVGRGGEIAVRVVGVDQALAERVGDARDAALGIALEHDPERRARDLRVLGGDAERRHGQHVSGAVGEALQARGLVDHEDLAVGARVAVEVRVEEAVAGVEELHGTRPAPDHLHRIRAHDLQLAERRAHGREAHRCGIDRDERLARGWQRREGAADDGQPHLELLHPAIRQRESDNRRCRWLEAVGRERARAHGAVPGETERCRRLHADAADVEPPARAEVAFALVAAVVRACDADRLAGHRHLEVRERDREVADLQVVAHHDGRRSARDASCRVGRRESDLVEAVQQQGRVEAAEHRGLGRRRAHGKSRPARIVREAALELPAREPGAPHAADHVDRLCDARAGRGVGEHDIRPRSGRRSGKHSHHERVLAREHAVAGEKREHVGPRIGEARGRRTGGGSVDRDGARSAGDAPAQAERRADRELVVGRRAGESHGLHRQRDRLVGSGRPPRARG